MALNQTKQRILISTHHRSGSTFTGELFNLHSQKGFQIDAFWSVVCQMIDSIHAFVPDISLKTYLGLFTCLNRYDTHQGRLIYPKSFSMLETEVFNFWRLDSNQLRQWLFTRKSRCKKSCFWILFKLWFSSNSRVRFINEYSYIIGIMAHYLLLMKMVLYPNEIIESFEVATELVGVGQIAGEEKSDFHVVWIFK